MNQSRSSALFLALAVGAAAGCAHKPVTHAAAPTAPVPTGELTAAAGRAADVPPSSDRNATATGTGTGEGRGLPGSVFFDFDSANLSSATREDLDKVAGKLKSDPGTTLRIEGNCDERGTTEYNLALGAHRADAAKRYLHRLGVADKRVSTTSYGSERPKNPAHDDQAWAENRRDDLILK